MMQQLLTGKTRLPGFAQPWRSVALGEVLSVRHGKAQKDVESQWGRYPILATGGQIGWAEKPIYDKPSVLIGRKGTIDKPQYQDSPFWTVDTLFYTEIAESVDPRYLYYVFLTVDWRSMNEASGVPSLSAKRIESVEVRLPGLEEQQAIRSVLDDIDSTIKLLQTRIAKARAIKQGMMQQLLTGKTRLPGFTQPWHDVALGSHVSYARTVPLSRAQLDDESPTRCLHYGDIHTRSKTMLDAEQEAMPRASRVWLRNADLLRKGDLIFADASEDPEGVGKSVELTSVPSAGLVSGLHTIAARFDKRILADGFKAYLQFIPSFRKSLLRLAAGTKVLATTRSSISSITVKLPTIAEQEAIAQVLTDVDREIDLLKQRLAKARAIKKGMMQELLTGRTRLPVEEVTA